MDEKQFEISLEFDGRRLDGALMIAYPELSLRARRRLWETMDIHVQGVARSPAYKVRKGQRVELLSRRCSVPIENRYVRDVCVVTRGRLFAALAKPGRVHSVRGKHRGCVEDLLKIFFPAEGAFMLNRLDYLTSGLILVGFCPEALDWYAQWQDEGRVVKTYLAWVHGHLESETLVRQAIDSSKRRKVRVLSVENPDPIRHTLITPLAFARNITLVKAEIHKGQRHQIRAHLASLGHPIVGDVLYGSNIVDGAEDRTMYLHHYKILMPDFEANCLPDWDI